MSNRQTELRQNVKFILSELIFANLDTGEFVDLEQWAGIFGFTEAQIRAEIRRQAELLRDQACR